METDSDILKGRKPKYGSMSVYADTETLANLEVLKKHNISLSRFLRKAIRLKVEELKLAEKAARNQEEGCK